ncbi:hypothetical protein [Luteimicrobium album]|uniref:hypothetical protein n=1 Tax=Luteimicrobium album TaxID=1054550 RepID=UPI0024E0F3D2|nr:hypothetical protein [Luteimicrobium album]
MNDSSVPSRSARRRTTSPHRAARVLFAVVLAAVVVGVVWKVGSLRDDPAVASTAAPSTAATTLPTFAAGSTAGALAPDLPASLAPVPDGATVLSSSAERSTDGAHVQFSLSLSTTAKPATIVTTYTKAWKKAGFTRASGKPKGPTTAPPTAARPRPRAPARRSGRRSSPTSCRSRWCPSTARPS